MAITHEPMIIGHDIHDIVECVIVECVIIECVIVDRVLVDRVQRPSPAARRRT
jgi:hypothetical protein